MAQIAGMDPNLEDHDLLFAVVLPNLAERIDDDELKKTEYTASQARQVDFANLPLKFNHNDDLPPVGRTIAYRVNEKTGGAPRAEVLFKLNREPDYIGARDKVSELSAMQRNLLMAGGHRAVSLGHTFGTTYVSDCGVHSAAQPTGKPGRVISKEAYEISTCSRGLREGSDIYEYMPCKRSLVRSTDDAVRSFVKLYGYTPPPTNLCSLDSGWHDYINVLHDEVRQRRRSVIENNGYASMLRARGFHAASNDARIADPILSTIPWLFVPHLAQNGVPGAYTHNIFENLGREVNEANA